MKKYCEDYDIFPPPPGYVTKMEYDKDIVKRKVKYIGKKRTPKTDNNKTVTKPETKLLNKGQMMNWKEFKSVVKDRLQSDDYDIKLDYLSLFKVSLKELFYVYYKIFCMNLKHESGPWYKKHKVMYSFGLERAMKAVDVIRKHYGKKLCTKSEADRLLKILTKLNITEMTTKPVKGLRSTGYKITR